MSVASHPSNPISCWRSFLLSNPLQTIHLEKFISQSSSHCCAAVLVLGVFLCFVGFKVRVEHPSPQIWEFPENDPSVQISELPEDASPHIWELPEDDPSPQIWEFPEAVCVVVKGSNLAAAGGCHMCFSRILSFRVSGLSHRRVGLLTSGSFCWWPCPGRCPWRADPPHLSHPQQPVPVEEERE